MVAENGRRVTSASTSGSLGRSRADFKVRQASSTAHKSDWTYCIADGPPELRPPDLPPPKKSSFSTSARMSDAKSDARACNTVRSYTVRPSSSRWPWSQRSDRSRAQRPRCDNADIYRRSTNNVLRVRLHSAAIIDAACPSNMQPRDLRPVKSACSACVRVWLG